MFFFAIFLLVVTQPGLGRGKAVHAHAQFDGKNYEYLKERFGLTEEELQRLVRTVKNELRQAIDDKYDNEQDGFSYDEAVDMKMQRDGMATKYVEKNQVNKMDDSIIHGERKKDQQIRRQKTGPDLQKFPLEGKPMQNKAYNGYRRREENQPFRAQAVYENGNKASKKSKTGSITVEAKPVKTAEENRKPVDMRDDSMYVEEESEDQPFSYYINPDIQDNHEQAKRDSQCSRTESSLSADTKKIQENVAISKNRLETNSKEVAGKKTSPQKGVFAPVKITKYVNNGGGYEEAGEYIVDLPAGLLNPVEKSGIQKLGDNIKYDK